MSATTEAGGDTRTDLEPAGLCWDCNYSLQGLAEPRCPECGRSFDPADPSSVNRGKPMGPLARRLLRPAPWYAWIIRFYCCAALVAAALVPLNAWAATILFFVFWFALSVPYLIRVTMRHVVIRRYNQPEAAGHVDQVIGRRVQRWTLWTGAMLLTRVPLYLAFAISSPWLNELAQERYERMPFTTVNSVPLPRHQYGLFRVMRVDVNVHGADLYIWGRNLGSPRLRYVAEGESFELNDIWKGSRLTSAWSVP